MTDLLGNPIFWFLAAVPYFFLGLYVIAVRGSGLLRKHFLYLAAAGLGSCIYLATFGLDSDQFTLDSWSFGVELAFMFAWFAMLYRLLRGPYRQSMPETVRRGLYLFWILAMGAGSLIVWLVYLGDGGTRVQSYYHVIALSIGLMCFALSAQLNRDAPVEDQIVLRTLAAAGGLMSGSQILFFGMATLTGSVPTS